MWIRLSNGWIVGSVWIFSSGLDRMEQAVSAREADKAYPILHVTGTNGKDPQSPFCVNCWWLTGKKVGTFASLDMISIRDRICIGDRRFHSEDLTRIGQRCNKWSRLAKQDQLSYLNYLPPWPSCILRNKLWMWSCWKLVSGGESSGYDQWWQEAHGDHFSWPRSPGNTGRDYCGHCPAKGRNLQKNCKKAVVGLIPMKLHPFVRKGRTVAVDLHAFQKEYGLEQDRFGIKTWNLLPSQAWRVITNGKMLQ